MLTQQTEEEETVPGGSSSTVFSMKELCRHHLEEVGAAVQHHKI